MSRSNVEPGSSLAKHLSQGFDNIDINQLTQESVRTVMPDKALFVL